jgi:hypothetical protein
VLGKQQWNKGLRSKRAAASRKQDGIQQVHQKNFRTGSHEAIGQVFHQAAENEWRGQPPLKQKKGLHTE